MSDRIRWIEHKGKKILFCDYSGLPGVEQLKVIEEAKNEMLKQPLDSVLLVLADITDTYTIQVVKEKFTELTEVRNRFKGSDATVGITGVKKIMANAIKRGIYFADTIEDAKEWLVKQTGE